MTVIAVQNEELIGYNTYSFAKIFPSITDNYTASEPFPYRLQPDGSPTVYTEILAGRTPSRSVTRLGTTTTGVYNENAPQPWRVHPLVVDYEIINGIANETTIVSLPNFPAFANLGAYGALESQVYRRIDVYGYLPAAKLNINHPNYRSLVTGYKLDNRTIPFNPIVISSENKSIEIKYYQNNRLESIPDLKSICWRVFKCNLIAGIPYTLPITDCVLGTLYIDDLTIESQVNNLSNSISEYRYADLFPEAIDGLLASWKALFDATNSNPTNLPLFRQTIKLHKLAANNNYWNNAAMGSDINFNIVHPMFAVNNQRNYNWHIKPQSDGSYGDLIMDSPRTIETKLMVEQLIKALNALEYQVEEPAIVGTGTIEAPQTPAKHKLDYYIRNSASEKVTAIWKALGGDKYSVNEIDDTKPRITTLGYLIENIARILGLRLDANGEIDLVKEKSDYLPQTINKPTLGLPSASGKYNSYGLSCWGTKGMIMPHLPTSYNQNGKLETLFDVVHDIPQQQMAILRQLDVALSIQHGSEIRVNGLDGKIHCYPNHLAVQLECLQKLEKVAYQVDKTLLVSTVAGTEIRELFSGIGIPVTQKFLPLKDPSNSKKVLSLPYFGHQKNQPSTAGLLANVQINLAVINGVLMPKKQPDASITNPFKRFVASE